MKRTIIILSLLVLSIMTTVFLGISLAYGFILPIIVVLYYSKNKKKDTQFALSQVKSCQSVFAIIILLGANITVWMSSGLLPTIIFHGLNWISSSSFLVITFLGTMIISLVMGTGLGTFSTIGIVFLGMALPLGYPKHVVIGAIVSGAFISDKISPVSALTNLTLQVTHIDYRTYLKEALKTLVPSIIITAIGYIMINQNFNSDGLIEIDFIQSAIYEHYEISLFLLLIPGLMMLLSVLSVSTSLNMTIMFVLGSLSTLLIQNLSLSSWIESVFKGYRIQSDDAFMVEIFKGGGIFPMVEVLIIVALAVFFTGLLTKNHYLDPLIKLVIHNTRSHDQLIRRTGLLSIFLTSITCDQTVGILVPAQNLKEAYHKHQLSQSALARVISDSGTIIAPLEFWNVNAIIITGLTGVSALSYGPYALLCFVSPLILFLFSFLKFDKTS